MKKFIIQDMELSNYTGQHVYLKADRTKTSNFDTACVFPESDAMELKTFMGNLKLIEVNVSLV